MSRKDKTEQRKGPAARPQRWTRSRGWRRTSRDELDFHPPLDIVDGAARVVDPVFEAERTGVYVWGKFFKDYATTSW